MDLEAQGYKPRFEFAYFLKKTQAENDKVLFSAWADGRISTESCILHWVKNNNAIEHIDPYKVDKFEFEGWLNFLGYFRKMYY